MGIGSNSEFHPSNIGVIEGLFDRDMGPRRLVYLQRRIQPHIMPKNVTFTDRPQGVG
jgi:hypothetical protein